MANPPLRAVPASRIALRSPLVPDSLPLLAPNFAAILNLNLEADDAYFQLATFCTKDPGLKGKLVGLANSALYGTPTDYFASAAQAIHRLGLRMAHRVAIQYIVANSFTFNTPHLKELSDKLWVHMLSTASLTRVLSVMCGKQSLENLAYLTGMLHDIGYLALLASDPLQAGVMMNALAQTPERHLEHSLMNTDSVNHAQLGRLVATRWLLPETVINALGDHHSLVTDVVGKPLLTQLVWLGERLIEHIEAGTPLIYDHIAPVTEALRLDESEIAELVATGKMYREEALTQLAA